MVDPNPNQDKKNRTLPGTDDSKSQASENTAAATHQNSVEEDKVEEEETKGSKPSPADPRLTNVPIPNPDLEDLKELFEQTQSSWGLKNVEKKLLMQALETGTFKKTAILIVTQLRQKKEYQKALMIEDHIPLFEPHRFCDEQPVPKSTDKLRLGDDDFNKPIEVKTVDQVQQEPYKLPAQYNWSDIDLNDEAVIEEVYNLLVENYVEDDDAMFRFDYSKEFLKWALLLPGGKPNWLIGVRGGKQ